MKNSEEKNFLKNSYESPESHFSENLLTRKSYYEKILEFSLEVNFWIERFVKVSTFYFCKHNFL